MAESRSSVPVDLTRILQEAQNRWLRPNEICEVLQNYHKFQLAPDPPVRPAAGSLFLFDRNAVRYFRKDDHRWRKKKDGKAVKESHEKLKAGSGDVLHCYYAHGEDNENFQLRSYWMLDGQLEHIVLVHYREVKEDYKTGISRVLIDPGPQAVGPQGGLTPTFVQANSPVGIVQTSWPSGPRQTGGNEGVDSSAGHDSAVSSDIHHMFSSRVLPHAADDVSGSSIQFEIQSFKTHGEVFPEQNILGEHSGTSNFITPKLTNARLAAGALVKNIVNSDDCSIGDAHIPAPTVVSQKVVQAVNSSNQIEKISKDHLNREGLGELKKFDSFSRWMDKEIGGDCDSSLITLDSGKYWCSLDAGNEDKEGSSLSPHMQLDVDSLGPSLSQKQLFSIYDFSPDWTYSGNVTKVLIVGSFLGSKKISGATKWGCMFGEVEVSAEVLTNNVLRCQTPFHAPGCIPFYVTCSNRLACSEVREFEYREKPSTASVPNVIKCAPEDEVHLQMRLTRLLNLGPEKKWLNCSIQKCEKCGIRSLINSSRSNSPKSGGMIERSPVALKSHQMVPRDLLIQTLLEDKLCDWLVCKAHKGTRGTHVLNDEGQGVIHLAAALGYEWAIDPIIVSGVSPNFRDSHGRTALHWASYFGREETVIKLVKSGAAPGAVDDPATGFPGGQTAADLASRRGHKGIAGYLAEAYLAAHLSTLTDSENFDDYVDEDSQSADVSSELVVDGFLSLKASLSAVRKSVRAASLIHAAFRARSFRHKQMTENSNAMPEDSLDLVALGILKKTEKIHYGDYLRVAAVRIQQNYRGWKGRKDFLKIRNHIAHVRGYQVRKDYKRVVWSVSIVEKAILRWRRKRVGLRGFKVEEPIGIVTQEAKKSDEYEFLRIGRKLKYADVEKALSKVQSMARYPEARDQYMRLVAKFENFKMIDEETKQDESSQEIDQDKYLPFFGADQ